MWIKAAHETDTIDWVAFGELLGIEYKDDDTTLFDYGAEEAHQWVLEYEKDADVKLDEELVDEIRFAIQDSISDHWSAVNVMRHNIDVDALVDHINKWSNMGPQMAIYEGELPKGNGIVSYVEDDMGVTFTLDEPFLTAFAEGVYGVMGIADEGYTLEDMTAKDVVNTMARINELVGKTIKLDLDRWDDQRSGLRYEDLVKIIEAHPDQVKSVTEE